LRAFGAHRRSRRVGQASVGMLWSRLVNSTSKHLPRPLLYQRERTAREGEGGGRGEKQDTRYHRPGQPSPPPFQLLSTAGAGPLVELHPTAGRTPIR
jgi:hypothetical protein